MPNGPTTAEAQVTRTTEEVILEGKRIEEDSLYTSKGHFAAAQLWSTFHLVVGIPTAVLGAVTAATAFRQVDESGVLTGLLALLVTALTALLAFTNPNERSSTHSQAGNEFDSLRNRTRIFWSIECWDEDDQVLTTRIKDFSDEKDRLNRNSAQVPWLAYRLARKGILAGEAEHAVDVASTDPPVSD